MNNFVKIAYSYAPFLEKDKKTSRWKPCAQPADLKVLRATGYVPVLGTISLIAASCIATVTACWYEKSGQCILALFGRATLSLVPPLLMVIDLVITLVDFHFFKKKLRENELAEQEKSLKIQERFPKKLLIEDKQLTTSDRLCVIATLRTLVQEVVSGNSAQSKILSDNDERKWLYFLKKYVCNNQAFDALFNAVIQDNRSQELLEFILEAAIPSKFNLVMRRLGDFYFKFGEKAIYVHEAILRQLGGTYFTAINSYRSYQKVTFMDLPVEDYQGFYQAYFSTLLGKKAHLTKKNIQMYLSVSHKYDFVRFKKQVIQWMLDNLDCFDPKQLFELADLYGCEPIKEALVEQVFSKKAGICLNQIKNISAYDKKLLRSWLPRVETLIVKSFISPSDVKAFRGYLKLCPNLKKIRLWTSSKEILLALKNIDKLENAELVLEPTFDSADFSCLAGIPITTLSLAGWQLSKEHFNVISDLPLKNLNLAQSKFKMANLNTLNGIVFNQLTLSKIQIEDKDVERYIRKLSVRHLDLTGTKITHRCLRSFKTMSLEELDLRKTMVSQYDCSKSHFKKTRVLFNDLLLDEQDLFLIAQDLHEPDDGTSTED
ncbi:MAG: hypothetical protein ACSNEK_08940 [Parachlamydiaceae bacterium]